MQFRVFTIDAFSLKTFTGNPAAVCVLEKDIADELKQSIAAEMNLSETCFITKTNESDSFETGQEFGLRWFTPTDEVPLCGHATLASGHALFNEIGNKNTIIRFTTASGVLCAVLRPDGSIAIELPIGDCRQQDEGDVRELVQLCVGSLPVKHVRFSETRRKLLICLADHVTRSQLEAMRPRTRDMTSVHNPNDAIRGIVITLKGSARNGCQNEKGVMYDFVSRYFAPWVGIDEDPVTGSAHTVLARYWSEQLGKTDFFDGRSGWCKVQSAPNRTSAKSHGVAWHPISAPVFEERRRALGYNQRWHPRGAGRKDSDSAARQRRRRRRVKAKVAQ